MTISFDVLEFFADFENFFLNHSDILFVVLATVTALLLLLRLILFIIFDR